MDICISPRVYPKYRRYWDRYRGTNGYYRAVFLSSEMDCYLDLASEKGGIIKKTSGCICHLHFKNLKPT